MEWWYLAGGLTVGLLLGVVAGRFLPRAERQELQQAREELGTYREQVTRHFARTAELVEVLAANSREIYQHLARGSEELCPADAVRLENDALLKPLAPRVEPAVAVGNVEVTESAPEATSHEVEPEQAPTTDARAAGDEWSEVLPEVGAYQGTAARVH